MLTVLTARKHGVWKWWRSKKANHAANSGNVSKVRVTVEEVDR